MVSSGKVVRAGGTIFYRKYITHDKNEKNQLVRKSNQLIFFVSSQPHQNALSFYKKQDYYTFNQFYLHNVNYFLEIVKLYVDKYV